MYTVIGISKESSISSLYVNDNSTGAVCDYKYAYII